MKNYFLDPISATNEKLNKKVFSRRDYKYFPRKNSRAWANMDYSYIFKLFSLIINAFD